jgi:hypothetical protein
VTGLEALYSRAVSAACDTRVMGMRTACLIWLSLLLHVSVVFAHEGENLTPSTLHRPDRRLCTYLRHRHQPDQKQKQTNNKHSHRKFSQPGVL